MNKTPRQIMRTSIRQKRQSLSNAAQTTAADDLLVQLKNNERVKHAQHIAIYLANDGELVARPFIEWCWQEDKSVYLPIIHPFSAGHLIFLNYNENTKMRTNQYGINEPKLDVTAIKLVTEIDIIFTPLVAFAQQGDRLGMGGGFYDRTLAHWYEKFQSNKSIKPFPIGLAHNCQKVASIPCESWDIPLPEIITPTQHYIF